ncbi:MAG: alpha/beta hydrolase [Acidobacteria bacterium]|nr:MAG: alpha/beta hydrolase [Acidobacteriota bacterium]REK03024.1 MAG: alpha/beta hydrolase [Acidobacteriota bacterium]REK13172.1 MAG: alpha/beta hydrolase [Acidobacteriota bacterium]REK41166.1 MAG: alpha/beta hydrolase [Acidobacteriota bacterium]
MIISAGALAQSLPQRDLRIHTLESKIFNNTRKIRVLLPPHYEKKRRKEGYSVLYLNDGQNLFDEADAIFNKAEWKVDETVTRLISDRIIGPIIVVGIDNAGKKMRPNEYLPWEDEYLDPPMQNPQGSLYAEFLEKEVIPFIESKYRARKKREARILGGSSYGALISLYSALKKPDLFGSLLLESPSFYVSDAKILAMAESAEKLPLKVYLGVGTNEMGLKECGSDSDGGEAVSDIRRLGSILKRKGLADGGLKVVVEKCAVHHEDAWAKRLPDALKFLFSTD